MNNEWEHVQSNSKHFFNYMYNALTQENMASQPTYKYPELIRQKIRCYKERVGDRRRAQFGFIYLVSQDEGSKSYNEETPKWHNGKKVHAETLLLEKFDEHYDAFCVKYGDPKMLILYSWIVPCTDCIAEIKSKLDSSRFAKIPQKVVAYTTKGTFVPGCNEDIAKEAFRDTSITLYRCKYRTKKIQK